MHLLASLTEKKKLILLLAALAAILFVFSASSQIFAQGTWYEPTPAEHAGALLECDSGNVGLECTVHAVLTGITNSLNYGLGGDPSGTIPGGRRPGAVGVASSLVGTLISNPPISSGDYVQYLAQRLNVAQPAYAQGTGYAALQPLIPLWAAIRNVAYLAFVVIFILIGFMIMFRARLNPQTVVNIQNSLPKLVITLLLITFSYAIAGFLVDLIYVGIFLIVSVLASQGLISEADTARNVIISENLFTFLFKGGIFRLSDTAGQDIQQIIEDVINVDVLDRVLGFIGNHFVQAILLVALLFSVFKLFFQLLMAYVQIILGTIFSPILILFNAIPGQQSFSNWLRNMLANVMVFPAVAAVILIGAVLIGPCETTSGVCELGPGEWGITEPLIEEDQPVWLPPFIGFTTDTTAVLGLLGYGFILFTPQVVKLVQQSLKAQPIPAAGVFAPLAAGTAVVTAPVRGAWGGVTGTARQVVGGYLSQKGEFAAGQATERRRSSS